MKTALLFLILALPASAADFKVEVLLQRQDVIWGFDFLPDGRLLFTERSGRLLLFYPKNGEAAVVPGVPKVAAGGQGGLLDVRVHPDFPKNRWVYLTYSQSVGKDATTALGRGRLENGELKDFTRLFLAREPSSAGEHFGSRLEFLGPHLFMTVGERNERRNAQDLSRHTGKILRLNHDGSAAKDNPFSDKPDAQPEIWSWGHRNPQGIARRPGGDEIWSCEMGPRGGDELNLIRPGRNYGWPAITYGREYWGPKIGETAKKGMEQPAAYWVPSISPSGMAFYDGAAFPLWKGNVFLANLSGQHLRRLTLTGNKVTAQEKLLSDRGWRFRAVRSGPDGYLYFSTDEGRFARLVPSLK